jgi:hypothetical protein
MMETGRHGFRTIDWARLPETATCGETGGAVARVAAFDDVRVRQVRYSPDFRAGCWYAKREVLLVLTGSLVVELQDGSSVELEAGQGCWVADGELPHRVTSVDGAVAFLVD